MTPEQKMQAIVEAAGEHWHSRTYVEWTEGKKLCNCGAPKYKLCSNPLPTALNVLFRLAEKLHILKDIQINYDHGSSNGGVICYVKYPARRLIGGGATPAEALLNALYESVKEIVKVECNISQPFAACKRCPHKKPHIMTEDCTTDEWCSTVNTSAICTPIKE